MPSVNRTALLPYSCRQMYDVVNDIEAYPSFLKWCEHATVLQHGERELKARLTLAKGPVRQSFVTANTMVPEREIRLRLEEGPFRFLSGLWRFEPVGDGANGGCEVSLHLEFEFKRGLVNRTFGQVFNPISNTLVDAFCQRAREIYG